VPAKTSFSVSSRLTVTNEEDGCSSGHFYIYS